VSTVTIVGVEGLGEITSGTDLVTEIAGQATLHDGDIVVVTSKVVSKAEGSVVSGDRAALVDQHTDRVVARRGATRIVRTPSGLTLAAAGLDASNTAPGTVVLLPRNADASAASLRAGLADTCGVNVGVVITDTAGRAWRAGQTDIAIGVAGLRPVLDLAGRVDSHGVALAVTAPAVADEIASAADLVQGKLSRIPVAVLRGLADQVLPANDAGPGAAALLRPASEDLFGWGAADAVRVAVRRDDAQVGRGFPAPDTDAAGLVRDAAAGIEARTLHIESLGAHTWGARAAGGCDSVAAAWAAGALVERLRTLAVSAAHRVDVQRHGAHPYVVRWSLHREPTAGSDS
jgi:coenzyme F420-0:L-glutamate ligase/coenzyme F420-1:gamma-L-glutamate ligase